MKSPLLSTYEIHVTVASDTDLGAFRVACDALGTRCLEIELPDGDVRRQPMTKSFQRGDLALAEQAALATEKGLARRGFTVVRAKIEEHGRLVHAPETDEEAALAPPGSYFEYHLEIPVSAAATDLDLRPLGASVSSNASRPGVRFATLRAAASRGCAERRLQALLAAVAARGFPARRRVREYVVLDSNPAVDAGWIAR